MDQGHRPTPYFKPNPDGNSPCGCYLALLRANSFSGQTIKSLEDETPCHSPDLRGDFVQLLFTWVFTHTSCKKQSDCQGIVDTTLTCFKS